jgi:hypothetical protein
MDIETSPRDGAADGAARFALFLLALLLLPVLAVAQAPAAKGATRLASLSIEIWPEFDRPAALVILRGVVADGVKLRAPIALRLPAAAGGAAAVAYSASADGNLLNLKNEQTAAGDYVTVKFDAPERFFHIEFYVPMPTTDPARSFRYVWPADVAVDRASVVVQEPAAALGLITEPNLEQTSTGAEGLNYRIGELGALPAGKPVPITIRYTKSDARPSVEIKGLKTAQAAAAAPASAAPVAAPALAASGLPPWVIPVGGFAAFGVIVALLVLLLWRRQTATSAAAPAVGFCKKCGAPLTADSLFCAKCGTKVVGATK